MVAEIWGDRKIPIVVAIGIVVSALAAHEYMDMHFVTKVYAEQQIDGLAVKIDAQGKLLETHIDKYEIRENQKAIDLIKDQQFDLKQFITVNGHNDMSLQREDELARKLARLEAIERCLINGLENCD